MNENYLWDKTGADAEIEDLENALQAFRYQETAAPRLPVKVVPVRNIEHRRRVQFAFAVAACLIFAVVFTGALFQISNNQTATETNLVQTNASEIEVAGSNDSTVKTEIN